MNKQKAIEVLRNFAREAFDSLPTQKKIAVYQALGVVLPQTEAREHANHISRLLQSTENHHQELFAQLFQQRAPGNGDGQGGHAE